MSYSVPPYAGPDEAIHRRLMAEAIGGMMQGRTNNTGELTLTANAASTVLNDPRLSVFSVLVFDPTTANAAAEMAAGTMFVTKANRNNLAWTITHANNAQTDRTFRYAVIGGKGLNYST